MDSSCRTSALRKEAGIQGIHLSEIAQVEKSNLDEDEIILREPGRRQSSEEISKSQLGLRARTSCPKNPIAVHRKLPADVAVLACHDRLADGRRRSGQVATGGNESVCHSRHRTTSKCAIMPLA